MLLCVPPPPTQKKWWKKIQGFQELCSRSRIKITYIFLGVQQYRCAGSGLVKWGAREVHLKKVFSSFFSIHHLLLGRCQAQIGSILTLAHCRFMVFPSQKRISGRGEMVKEDQKDICSRQNMGLSRMEIKQGKEHRDQQVNYMFKVGHRVKEQVPNDFQQEPLNSSSKWIFLEFCIHES